MKWGWKSKVCPYCGSTKVVKFGHTKGKQRYRCANKHTFYDLDDYAPVTKRRSRWFL